MRLEKLYILFISLLFVACIKDDVDIVSVGEPIEVHIRGVHGDVTRTALDGIGSGAAGSSQSIRWVEDDQIMVWAKEQGASGYTLDGQTFWLRTYNTTYGDADFVSNLSTQMEEDKTYNYYALYPKPASVTTNPQVPSSRYVSYTIPAAQSGKYDPSLDVMVAQGSGRGLAAREEYPSNIGLTLEPSLNFSPLFHLIRIQIPEGGNGLEIPIKRLEITFPQPVVGRVSFDATSVDANFDVRTDGEWINTSNKITVELDDDNLLDANDGYVWLHIMPTTIKGQITFKAYNELGISSGEAKSIPIDKVAEPMHITPISFTVPPSPYAPFTYIDIKQIKNNLGEDWQTMTLTGQDFFDPTTNTIRNEWVFYPNENNSYKVAVSKDASSMKNATIILKYESEHTLFDDPIILSSSITSNGYNVVEKIVPYLLEEDFTNAKNFEHNDTYKAESTSNTNTDGKSLNGYMPTNGWSASRFKISGGNSARIGVRYQSGAWVVGRYCGRLDTPALTKLKPNANATISVEYDMGCYVPEGHNTDDRGNAVTYCEAGYHTETGNELSGENQNDVGNRYTNVYKSSNYTSRFNNNSFGESFPNAEGFEISGAGKTTRVCWWACTTQSSSKLAANCHYYLYIDNIKIKIVDNK